MADVSKIQLPDNTVLNIKDSRISDVGTFVQKSGGTMDADAELEFVDTDEEYWTSIYPGELQTGGQTTSVAIDGSGFIQVSDNRNNGYKYSELYADKIQVAVDAQNIYDQTFPAKSGTFAMTSDIPSTSNFVQKSGGDMSTNATLGFSTHSSDLTVKGTEIDIEDSYMVHTKYQAGGVAYGSYTQTFPSKSGTFAMTSDIPSVPVTDVTVGGSSVVSSGTAVIPAIPSAPGTLDTTATTSQTTSASESLSGSVTLHKVSKTGSYYDLTSKPWIRGGYNDYSICWGNDCAVGGTYSLAEGYKCETGGSSTSNTKTASQTNIGGSNSHAEGNATIAKGLSCHSEGKKTFASGEGSHAEGIETEAKGVASHSEGEYTQANNKGEHAEGRYNKSTWTSSTYGNAGNTTHSIGIGTSTSNRKNAVEVMENGDAYLYGVGSYDGTNYSAATTVQSILNNIPDTSTLVPKSGGTMNAQATLTFTDSDGLYTVEIDHEAITAMDDDDGFSVSIDSSLPSVVIFEGSDYAEYRCDHIRYSPGNNNYYSLYFPSDSGTLALTSQIPTVESLTTSEIDSIWTNAS